MNDYWNDPPDQPEPPECCDEMMDVDDKGVCVCLKCGKRIEPPTEVPEPPDLELTDDYLSSQLTMPHFIPNKKEVEPSQFFHPLSRSFTQEDLNNRARQYLNSVYGPLGQGNDADRWLERFGLLVGFIYDQFN